MAIWRPGSHDYTLLSPARGGGRSRMVIIATCGVLLLLMFGAYMHPSTTAAIERITAGEQVESKPAEAATDKAPASLTPSPSPSPAEAATDEAPASLTPSPSPSPSPSAAAHPEVGVPAADEPTKWATPVLAKGPVERPEYILATDVVEKDKYAYIVFLSSTPKEDNENLDSNEYFVACRMLVWQLKHDPATRSSPDIDLVILAGPDVGEAHRERLRQDGAIVKGIEIPHGKNDSWIVPSKSRWIDVMGKLRAWEMEEYSRVLMLDGDMLLQSPLDKVFDDRGAALLATKPDGHRLDEPELPSTYQLGSFMEIAGSKHEWPASDVNRETGYFNAGFFMLKPDKKMYDYYVGLLDLVDRFDPQFPEQNLLNYAHRWDGPMPWRDLDGKWNSKFTSEEDLQGGVVSMHEKWWKLRSGGQKLREFVLSKRWQAEGYWLAQREAAASNAKLS